MGQRELWRAQLATWSRVVLGGEEGLVGKDEWLLVDYKIRLIMTVWPAGSNGRRDVQSVLHSAFCFFLTG